MVGGVRPSGWFRGQQDTSRGCRKFVRLRCGEDEIGGPADSWQERFIVRPHRVLVSATDSNGLEVDSTADVLHLRSLSVQRFRLLMGVISDDDLAAIQRAILTVLGMDPQ